MVSWPAAKLTGTDRPSPHGRSPHLPASPAACTVLPAAPAVLAPAPPSCPALCSPASCSSRGRAEPLAATICCLTSSISCLLAQSPARGSNLLLQCSNVLCCCLRHAVPACMEGAQGHGVGGNIGQVCHACSTRLRGLERKKSSHHHERSPFCTRHSLAQPTVFCGTLQKALVAAGQTEREEEKGKGGLASCFGCFD